MVIDAATASDIPALSELLGILFTQESDFQPDVEAQHRGLAAIIDRPDLGQILVAREAGQAIGMVNLLFTISTALGDRVAWLEDMVVAPRVRASGVGSQLLQRAIDLARSRGCRRITLLTDATNQSAQRFYRRHGFQGSAMIPLRLMLD
ncbi:MAG: GNAT family N-acetyltransferase [Burkholderiales bacterium]|nr:GNAT family N-acetyltransferase [Burkholderiales bacterium]